jgi:asparagine synthetase B (glutamine-hydrolysing)
MRTFGKKKNNRPWLPQETRNYVKLVCPADSAFYTPPHLDLLSQLVYSHTRRVYDLVRLSALDVMSAYTNIELRHPFLDRRLVDFLLHIPQHLRSWQGLDRVMLRRSMTDILPDAIRRRGKTIHFSGLVERGLMKERSRIEGLLQHSQLDKLGLLDSQLLHRNLLDFWSGETLSYRHFFQPLYLESWLQARDK